eukprot:gene10895-12892_t
MLQMIGAPPAVQAWLCEQQVTEGSIPPTRGASAHAMLAGEEPAEPPKRSLLHQWHLAPTLDKVSLIGAVELMEPAAKRPASPRAADPLVVPSRFRLCPARADSRLLLLLGDAANAAAASATEGFPIEVNGTILNVKVHHIVCIADGRHLKLVRETAGRNPAICFEEHHMQDRLAPEDIVPISRLEKVFSSIDAGMLAAASPPPAVGQVASPSFASAVIVHCNKGHNRSPAAVLGWAVRCGMSLREAYRLVLSARPTVDPLENYRSLLLRYELDVHGKASMSAKEPFAMHLTELLELCDAQNNGSEPGNKTSGKEGGDLVALAEAMRLREASIRTLLDLK